MPEPSHTSRTAKIPSALDARRLDEENSRELNRCCRLQGNTWFLPERSVDPRGLGQRPGQSRQTSWRGFCDRFAGNRSAGGRWPRGRCQDNSLRVCCGHRRKLCRSLGCSNPAALDSDASGERPDGLPGAASRSAPHAGPLIQHVVRTPEHLHHSPLRWSHSAGRNCRGSWIRQARRSRARSRGCTRLASLRFRRWRRCESMKRGPDCARARLTTCQSSGKRHCRATMRRPDTIATEFCLRQ